MFRSIDCLGNKTDRSWVLESPVRNRFTYAHTRYYFHDDDGGPTGADLLMLIGSFASWVYGSFECGSAMASV